MSAKPIIIIKMPRNLVDAPQIADSIYQSVSKKLNDYHIIVVVTMQEDFSFEVFYEKDHKPIDFDGLKKLIENARQ